MATGSNKTLDELFAENFSEEERAEVEDRAAVMLLEVRLGQLRQALGLTQEQVAEALDRNQSAVAAFEKRNDMLVSTLSKYMIALGGTIELVARVPNKRPVRISLTI